MFMIKNKNFCHKDCLFIFKKKMTQLLKLRLSFKNFFGYANHKNIMFNKIEYMFYEPEIHIYLNKKYHDKYTLLCYTSSQNVMVIKNHDVYSCILFEDGSDCYFEIELLSSQGNILKYVCEDTLIFNSYSKVKIKSGLYNG